MMVGQYNAAAADPLLQPLRRYDKRSDEDSVTCVWLKYYTFLIFINFGIHYTQLNGRLNK